MTKYFLLAVVALMIVVASYAAADETTVLSRVDMNQGSSPSYTEAAFLTKKEWNLEVWGLCLPDFPIIEIGKLAPVYQAGNTSVNAGGYISWWDKASQLYLEPWVNIHRDWGNGWSSCLDLVAYVPVTGHGNWVWYIPEVNVMKDFGSFAAGLAATTWDEEGGSADCTRVGLKACYRGWSVRQLWGVGGDSDSTRVQYAYGF